MNKRETIDRSIVNTETYQALLAVAEAAKKVHVQLRRGSWGAPVAVMQGKSKLDRALERLEKARKEEP